jgi:hypothetical protein
VRCITRCWGVPAADPADGRLTYLKHCYNLSDEQVCERWLENPLYQAEQVLLAAAPLIMAKTGTLSIAESPLNLISGQASPEPKSLMQAESSTENRINLLGRPAQTKPRVLTITVRLGHGEVPSLTRYALSVAPAGTIPSWR